MSESASDYIPSVDNLAQDREYVTAQDTQAYYEYACRQLGVFLFINRDEALAGRELLFYYPGRSRYEADLFYAVADRLVEDLFAKGYNATRSKSAKITISVQVLSPEANSTGDHQ